MQTLTCSFDVITLALATGCGAVALEVTASPLVFAVAESAVKFAPDSGFCALALVVFPYTARALLTMFMMRLISWYDARNTIGFAPTSIPVNC